MFNYKAMMNGSISKNITINKVIDLICNSPEKEKIQELRKLKAAGSDYKELKDTLPVFVPNALFKTNLDHDNFISGTGYYYLDIDDKEIDAYELKKQFLDKYKDLVYLCWVSASLGGIGILVRLNDVLSNVEDFHSLYTYLTKEVFSGYTFDKKVKNAGRVNFISYDPDLFINNDSVIEISDIDLNICRDNSNQEKGAKQYKLSTNSNHTGIAPFFEETGDYKTLLLQTDMNWDKDEFVKFEMVESYLDCRIYGKVNAGKKRDLFTQLIVGLLELNGVEKANAIFGQIKFLNRNNTTEPIPGKELLKLFNSVLKGYKNGTLIAIGKPKYIHLNPSIKHCTSAKMEIRNKMAGYAKRLRTQYRIEQVRKELVSKDKKVTQKIVSELTGFSLRTVKNYWNLESLELIHFDEFVTKTNDAFKNNRQAFYDRGYINREITSIIEEIDFLVDEEVFEAIHKEVMDTPIQDENVIEYKHIAVENGDDEEEKNSIYESTFQKIASEYKASLIVKDRKMSRNSIIALEHMSMKHMPANKLLKKIRA